MHNVRRKLAMTMCKESRLVTSPLRARGIGIADFELLLEFSEKNPVFVQFLLLRGMELPLNFKSIVNQESIR